MTKSFADYLRTNTGYSSPLQPQDNKQYSIQPISQKPVESSVPLTSSGSSYVVRPGDTLSAIAKQYGVNVSDITGYRSGNPNLIYPGESLSISGSASKPSTLGNSYQQPTPQPTSTQTIQNPYTSSPAPEENPTHWTQQEGYPSMVDSLKNEIRTAQEQRETSRLALENARTNMYNEEYKTRDLDSKKQEISMLDSDITNTKNDRDEAILTARRNPNVSAGVLAGEIGKITDYYNNVINNSIEKRNSLASTYNTELDEIDRVIENSLGDLMTEYGHWDNMVKEVESQLGRYEDIIREELSTQQQQSNWEKQLAQQLALKKEDQEPRDKWNLITDVLGQPSGFFNPYTREYEYYDGTNDGGNSPSLGALPDSPYQEEPKSWWQKLFGN